ncbi:hypothetical protein HPB51_012779 [Rhipicephalus microplus]|uniref:THAP-type domain-containing protein n=1 Tax=Rhipicephalus microplus TaxID=6941 RepID=A0A9J6E976_RHIMP|nr:hypothetical protein HPB51_012779 [Rhipicephalus microplus]
MPNTCCVPGCRSGYRGTTEKVSLFSFPPDKDQREKWKRAIPRQESGDFNFESKYTRVCAKHFDASDIVTTYDFNINGDAVSLERDKPTLKADAVPSIFGGLPSYLTKRKPRPRSSTNRSPRKRARESSCETEEQRASPTTCSDRTDAASVNEADVALTSETVETYHTDTACQTDRLVDCASCAAVQKLRCQLRAAKQQLRQCQTKLAEFRKKTAKYERQQQSLQRLSDREKLIIDQCVMKANAKSARAVRYKKDWLYDCLLLKTKSTSVYTYLQENNFLPLPNPRTLYCYMKSLKADFGFDAHVFTVLKEKLLTSPESERRGVLMFDEMSVRKSLHVRESDMKVVGKVDFGEHTRPADREKDADHVLVFLFRPFLGGWSQTVGTFCASSAAPGSILAKLVLQCIVHLCNAGAVIDAVTCDNSTTNRCALRSLGIRGDMKDQQVSFQHPCDPSKVIYAIIDPPHIFKCIRNTLQKVGKFLLPQGREVYHDHYAALLEYEEQQSGLRAVPKLTRAHIYPNAFQKMSVKLAVQLFSESTATAMIFYSEQESCKKLHGSAGTSEFTRQMNRLFDCLNSRRPEHVQYSEAEHVDTLKEGISWLDRCCKYIESLPKQRQVCFLSKPTCEALRITLLSTISLVENLLASGFRYVLVGKFGQDPLEHTSNTVFAFQADCLAILFDEVLLEPGETVEQASLLQHQQSPKEKILDYLAGYVAKKFSSLRCSSCVESLRSSERPATGLILVKSKGFLLVPSSQLVTLLQIVEDHMEAHTVEKTACSGVYMNIVEDVLMDPRTASAAVGCKSHFVSTTAEVVQFFLKAARDTSFEEHLLRSSATALAHWMDPHLVFEGLAE